MRFFKCKKTYTGHKLITIYTRPGYHWVLISQENLITDFTITPCLEH